MNILILTATCLALFGLLLFIDNRVKGNFSILVKTASLIAIATLLVLFVLWYGQSVFETIQVDIKSLTNLKQFFNSRILGILAILIYLLLFLKTFYVIFRFTTKPSFARKEKAIVLISIVFDIAVVPCIVKAGSFNVVLLVPAILSLVETGLALTKKLVFSISYYKNKEALA